MKQNIVSLPETADIEIAGKYIIIKNYEVVLTRGGFLYKIMCMVNDSEQDKNTLEKFEDYGVSFEAAIEYCIHEIEDDTEKLANIIWLYDDASDSKNRWKQIDDKWSKMCNFSASVKGREIAEEFVENIRSCTNWVQLHETMNKKSVFQKDMKQKIEEGIRWYKK